jgi:sugar O-acyltransferase (sialic acid O-acetyltransferase NeuD family)
MPKKLVIFGSSNILSDLFDCALANHIDISKVVIHLPEEPGERDLPLAARILKLNALGQQATIEQLDDFTPEPDEIYLLGPTTPTRSVLADELQQRFGLSYTTLIHSSAYVSPLATISQGVFIGANSIIGPGAHLAEHVFVNRGVTIGHDTQIGAFSRIQPGSNLGGLSHLGMGVTVGIGATLIERLRVGDNAFIGAGAVVTADIDANVLVVGIPAKFKKSLLT